MKTKGHSLNPHTVDRNTWFYDDDGGMLIIHEIRDDAGKYLRTERIKIRWQSVLAAAERHGHELRKKK